MRENFLLTLRSMVFSQTSKDSSILLSGTVISTLLNLVLVVILTRSLTVEEYGLFVTGLTFIQLLTDGADLGVNSATLNFLPGSKGEQKAKVIKTTLTLKLLIGILVAVLVFLLSGQISNYVFKSSGIEPLIKISSLGIFLMLLIFWGQNIFQGEKKFFPAMIVNTSINVLRTGVILLLILLGSRNLNSLFFASQIILIFGVGYALLKIDKSFIREKISSVDYKRILKFGLPIGVGFALAAVYTKLDQILILNLGGEREAGIYGLALKLSTFFVFAGSAFSNAFVPRFSSLGGREFMGYFNKTVFMSMVLAAVPLISIPFSALLIPLIFPKFSDSIPAFQILAVAMAFFILSSPFYSAIIYRYKKSQFSLILGVISLIMIYLLLHFFIPLYGSVGAAIAVNLTYLFQLIISAGYFFIL